MVRGSPARAGCRVSTCSWRARGKRRCACNPSREAFMTWSVTTSTCPASGGPELAHMLASAAARAAGGDQLRLPTDEARRARPRGWACARCCRSETLEERERAARLAGRFRCAAEAAARRSDRQPALGIVRTIWRASARFDLSEHLVQMNTPSWCDIGRMMGSAVQRSGCRRPRRSPSWRITPSGAPPTRRCRRRPPESTPDTSSSIMPLLESTTAAHMACRRPEVFEVSGCWPWCRRFR